MNVLGFFLLSLLAVVAFERWPRLPIALWKGLRSVVMPLITVLIWTSVALSALFIFMLVIAYPRMEAYCFFNPSIDTRYAPGYSEKAFDTIRNGMSVQDVRRLLGSPLYEIPAKDETEKWGYTSDGKCTWGDWAWLGRHIVFRDGKVVETVKHIYYD